MRLIAITVALLAALAHVSTEEEVTAGPIVTTTKKFELNIKGSSSTPLCKNEDGKEGYCLSYTLCNENKTVLLYGDPDENDLRSDEKCAEFHHFCCVLEGPWKEDGNNQKDDPGCVTASENDCPWCVSIYKDGGNPAYKNPSGLFCGGVLLSEDLVLTTASCVAATRHQKVWVKLANDPRISYDINFAVSHPKYHSGTREFDFALLELSQKVSQKPACVQRQMPRADAVCRAFGYDKQDNLITTTIKIDRNRCDSDEPDSNGGACGLPTTEDSCEITLGSPVICPYQDGYALWGLSRSSCQQGYSYLGYFSVAEGWAKPYLAIKPSQFEEKMKSHTLKKK